MAGKKFLSIVKARQIVPTSDTPGLGPKERKRQKPLNILKGLKQELLSVFSAQAFSGELRPESHYFVIPSHMMSLSPESISDITKMRQQIIRKNLRTVICFHDILQAVRANSILRNSGEMGGMRGIGGMGGIGGMEGTGGMAGTRGIGGIKFDFFYTAGIQNTGQSGHTGHIESKGFLG